MTIKTGLKSALIAALLFTWLLFGSQWISKRVICSRLVSKREFVRQLQLLMPKYRTDAQYNYCKYVEIAKYNAWLIKMKWLRDNGLAFFLPIEIEDESEIRP
jgi:hypothetical protein